MTAEDFASASQLLDLLRQKGARTFKGFGIELELSPLPVKEEVTPESKTVDGDKCSACGCASWNHGPSGCTTCDHEPEACFEAMKK
jgi:hypothetical protein